VAVPTMGQYLAAHSLRRPRALLACMGEVTLAIALVRHVLDWARACHACSTGVQPCLVAFLITPTGLHFLFFLLLHGVTLQLTKTDQVLTNEAMKKWELKWLAIRREVERENPYDKDSAQGDGEIQPVFQGLLTWRRGSFGPLPLLWLSDFEGAYPRHCQASTGLPWVESRSRVLERGQTPIRMHPMSTA
jgi:hypothetical protein